MNRPDHDPSIEFEPHLQRHGFRPDSSEHTAQDFDTSLENAVERVDHSVWDEPGISSELAGELLDDDLTYARLLEEQVARSRTLQSWLITLGVALIAGPLAILGAVFNGQSHIVAAVVMVVIAPTFEEIMKLAIPLWIVEKRPWLFRSPVQIVVTALASGFVFAAIENVMYLEFIIDNPGPNIVLWRWTICVALHMGCSVVGGFGLICIWRTTMRERTRPHLPTGAPFLMAAVMIHAAYNGTVLVFALTGHDF